MLVNFGWIREGQVAGMGQPHADTWAALEAEGIGAVLVLTEHAPTNAGSGVALEIAHVPLVDFGTPSEEQLERCVQWIDEQIDAGRAVVVHCTAGQGRTGTVLAAWLVGAGMSARDAVREVRQLRPGSIETSGQLAAIQRFRVEPG